MSRRSAAEYVPSTRDLAELASAAQTCRGCDLFADATQTVFGEGPATARLMLIGEQPGDREDVAPVYVTNAVKHFKFTPAERGVRRIHKTPSRTEVVACRPWLFAELEAVKPDVVVLLGATAAKSLLGNDFRVTAHRGEVLRLPPDGAPAGREPRVVATIHPSAVLRGPAEAREENLAALVADLKVAAQLLDA